MTFPNKQQLTQISQDKRFLVLIYGVVSYAIAMLTILYLIFYSAGKHSLASIPLNQGSIFLALWINLILVFLFGLQHSIMARPVFKKWWTQKIPVAAETKYLCVMFCYCFSYIIIFLAADANNNLVG